MKETLTHVRRFLTRLLIAFGNLRHLPYLQSVQLRLANQTSDLFNHRRQDLRGGLEQLSQFARCSDSRALELRFVSGAPHWLPNPFQLCASIPIPNNQCHRGQPQRLEVSAVAATHSKPIDCETRIPA